VSKIELGRYSSLLRRTLGMKGTTEVAGELSPEVSPTIQLESSLNPEWDFLKDVRNCGVTERITNNVAGGGQMLLLNPVNSGVIAVVRLLLFNSAVTAEFTARLLTSPAALLNSALPVAFDTRWGQTAVLTQSALTATFQNNLLIGVGTGTIIRFDQIQFRVFGFNAGVVLTPGFGLVFGCRTVNVVATLSAYWHERQLPPLEL